jgi:hypothetical protein
MFSRRMVSAIKSGYPVGVEKSSYNDLINTFGTKKYYVDYGIGIDSAGRGSIGSPYKTIDYAVTNAVTGSVIVLSGNIPHYMINGNGLFDQGKSISFVARYPGVTKINIDGSAHSGRDQHATSLQTVGSAVYGCILAVNFGARNGSYTAGIFNNGEYYKPQVGNVYNCVFDMTNGLPSGGYYNFLPSPAFSINYCTFKTPGNIQNGYYYNVAPTGVIYNSCACNLLFNNQETYNACVQSVILNSTNYSITGITNKGVYAGAYSW